MKKNHNFFSDLAFNLAEIHLGKTNPNPSVGCIIVKNNSVIFNYKLKNLSDYVESQDILKNNNMIISFEDIEVTKTKYKGKISFLGTLENLNESLSNSGFLFKKKNNGLLLKRND